jgi:hypothetical protein
MMKKMPLNFALLSALSLSATSVFALPFNSFDPRSMGMGGAGVAVGDPATAPFFNPALLSASDPAKKYSVEFPVIGVRLYDPANMRTELNTLSSNITAMNNSISTAQVAANGNSVPALRTALNSVVSNVNQVNTSLSKLSNQPLQGEFGAATVIGVPGQNYGVAFYANAYGALGGTLEYNDAQQLTNYANAINATLNGTPTSPTNITLTSKLHLRGVTIAEAGLSISHGFAKTLKAPSDWSLGVTPKIIQLQLFDALLDPAKSSSNATGNDYLATYSTMNLDVGAAKVYANGWRTGAVIKNLIPQSFDFKTAPTPGATPVANGSTLNLKPQVRVGVSRENSWSTVALDVDLMQNDPAGLENKSQYVALGGELSAWGWAQFRAGYRADLVNSSRSVASIGLGLSPRIPYFKIHTDIAVAGNANEMGASLRFGFNF